MKPRRPAAISQVHHESGVAFCEIPAGSFRMGLSNDEVAFLNATLGQANAMLDADPDSYYEPNGTLIDPDALSGYLQDVSLMQPTQLIDVPSFRLARHPLTYAQARRWLPGLSGDNNEGARLDAKQIDTIVAATGWRLPFEVEWEYAARAGTETITFRGGIPSEHDLLGIYGNSKHDGANANPWGLVGLFAYAELCADAHTKGYSAPAFQAGRAGQRVTRGGAIDLSPWQGCGEWMAMLSASRGREDWATIGMGLRPVLP